MNQHFQFVRVPDLVDGDLTLKLAETGHKGPEHNQFAYYRFNMLQSHSGVEMGWITLRVGDADGILRFPGHVGFTVYEAFRGNRYAVRATKLVLSIAAQHDLHALWLGCSVDNTASIRCCELLGAELAETAEVPPDIDLYAQGIRQLCRYRLALEPRS
jgi:tagatose 1,6-diphosphate aldolase